MSATLVFLCLYFTARTSSNIWSKPWPNSKATRTFIVTPPFVPILAASEAHLIATLAHGVILAAARFFYSLFTVWPWTPLYTLVLTDLNILLDLLVDQGILFGAKLFHLFSSETKLAISFHTFDLEDFTALDADPKMFLHTLPAKLMPARESKEIFWQRVRLEAHVANSLTKVWQLLRSILD